MCKLSCNSARSDGIRDPRRTVPWHHTSLCQWREALMWRKCILLPISGACEQRWRHTTLQQGRCNPNAASDSDTHGVTAAKYLGVWVAGTRTHLGSVTPNQQLKYCSCGGNHTSTIVAAVSGKKQRRLLQSERKGQPKDGVSTRLPAPKSAPAKPSPEQEKLSPGWNHVVRGGHVVQAQATSSPSSTSSDTGRRTERQAAQRAVKVSPLVLKCWW
jgi:hypothetical protein